MIQYPLHHAWFRQELAKQGLIARGHGDCFHLMLPYGQIAIPTKPMEVHRVTEAARRYADVEEGEYRLLLGLVGEYEQSRGGEAYLKTRNGTATWYRPQHVNVRVGVWVPLIIWLAENGYPVNLR